MKAIHKLSEILYTICGIVTGVIMTGLCILIVISVFARFILNSPISWQYELTLVGLSCVIFIGMPMTFCKQEHLRLTFISDKFGPKVWRIYMDVIDVLLIAFLVIGVKESIGVVKTTWGTYYQTIPIRNGIFYLSFPIGCAVSIVHLIDVILNRKPEDAPKAKKELEA